MGFSVKSLGRLIGIDARTLIPKDARPISTSDHDRVVRIDPEFNTPIVLEGYHEEVFDLDGDGKGDVIRRVFDGGGIGFEFKDQNGDRLCSYVNPSLVGGENLPERIVYSVAEVGAERKTEADYDSDGEMDATLAKSR